MNAPTLDIFRDGTKKTGHGVLVEGGRLFLLLLVAGGPLVPILGPVPAVKTALVLLSFGTGG